MDEVDRAEELTEMALQHALFMARKSGPLIAATGQCLHCDEPLEDGRRWCDKDCVDGYEREQRWRKLNA